MKKLFIFFTINCVNCYLANKFYFNRRFKLKDLFSSSWSNRYDNKCSGDDFGGSKLDEDKKFKLMELPFKMDELSPEISKETVEFHYLKHHQGYVNKLNELGRLNPYVHNFTLEGKINNNNKYLELIKTEPKGSNIYNMATQVWNHDFYWMGLDPNSQGKPTPYVENLINESFGSFEYFKQKYTDTAMKHFGSGWVWLLYYKYEPHLRIVDTHDSDNPMKLFNLKPLLVLDVWEHAYYIDYRNDKKNYVDGWFKKVNWNRVEELVRKQS